MSTKRETRWRSFRHVILAWGGQAAFARAHGLTLGAVQQMFRRNSIDSGYWRQIVSNARESGIDLTLEDLAELSERRKHAA